MVNIRQFKHPTSGGDSGDAFLYLQALLEESEKAARDFEGIISAYSIKTYSEVVNRAGVVKSYVPGRKQLSDASQSWTKKRPKALQRDPLKFLDMVRDIFPKKAREVADAEVDNETFHRKFLDKLDRFNKKWLHHSEKGYLALEMAIGIVTISVKGEDLAGAFWQTPLLRELIFGSKLRSRSADTQKIRELAQAIRKGAQKLGYQNKNSEIRLEHARLAVRVIHRYHGSLELTLEKECDNPYCPTSRSTLSGIIQLFYRSLGIELKRGRKPLEGLNPFQLPYRIRNLPNSPKAWHRHK